jgi:poly-gamma-glutamate synthesis protein (capsule biosynthesis protein)
MREVKEEKSYKKKTKVKIFPMTVLIVLLLMIFFAFLFRDELKKEKIIHPEIPEQEEIEEEIEEEIIEEENIVLEQELSLIMVGDCLIHGAVYDDAREDNNKYNFDKMLDFVKPIVEKYDLAFYNQESILGGTKLGLSSYPTFNSPQEVGDSFLKLGFNLVSLANNHTLDRGKTAIYESHKYWKKQEGVMTAGSYSSEEERITPNIMEKNGITYTLLSYTTTTNGIPKPKDAPYLVSTYNKEEVKKDIERLRDKVDLLMVSMHWGEEYSHTPNNSQKEIANYLASLGVDIIIGHHPHVVQPIDFIGDTMVIYSLGNFISSQYGINKLTGLMASVNIKKQTIDGKSKIILENPQAELVYTYSKITSYRHSYKLYPYTMLNENILENYKEHYNKYMGIVTSMSKRIIPIGIK